MRFVPQITKALGRNLLRTLSALGLATLTLVGIHQH
jgi:hypothetical protein